MEFIPSIKEPYQAVLDEKWKDMEKYYSAKSEDPMGAGAGAGASALLFPISMDKDTAFHLAVYSGGKQPLERLLDLFENDSGGMFDLDRVFMQNIYGNTVLHEATISGNLEAVEILVSKFPELVKDTNKFGETPLFRAAAFGKTKIVKHLASQPDQVLTDNGEKQLQNIHRKREDGASILHAAVQGEHFGRRMWTIDYGEVLTSAYTLSQRTALELLELDEELANLKYFNNGTSLYMLAKIPSVFKRGRKMNIFKKLLYICLPIGNDHDDDAENIEYKVQVRNGETNGGRNDNSCCLSKVTNCIYIPIWRLIIRGCPLVRKLWKEKRYRKFAYDLAVKLIEIDKSWEQSITGSTTPPYEDAKDKSETTNQAANAERDQSPLFAAAKTGNTELVEMILKEHPQALEYKNRRKQQNILHLAVKYRQKEIFDYVITKRVPMLRLVRQIDVDGYTVLHSVADTKHYTGGTRSGPAYNLQEELEWFSSVKRLMPTHYRTFPDIKNKTTAMELFKEKHEKQLENAQRWIKETSQSCSGVAVLVATVVFAAAFTVPGGTNDSNGRPILLHSTFFLFFTVMDVVSLSCSLTAVVMFLSIITSPFELHDFLVSLPRRLTLGFALLFMSVATTMLAFTSTIFLIIHLDHRRQWTMTLICSAAFFPVSVLALTHFPLFVSFLIAWKNLFKFVWEALPCNLLLGWLKDLGKTTREQLPITDKGK